MNRKAEEIRIRYLYRNLVLRRKICLPIEVSMKIVGSDCAYHLYSVTDTRGKEKKNSKSHSARAPYYGIAEKNI
jgi:hypothetical protein